MTHTYTHTSTDKAQINFVFKFFKDSHVCENTPQLEKNIWNSKHFWAESFLIRDAQLVSLQLGRLLGLLDSRLKKRLPDSCLVLISQRGMRSLGSGSIGAFELGNNRWRARTQTGRRQRLLSKPSGLPLWPPVSRDPGLGLTEQQCSVPALPIQHHRTEAHC